MKKEGKEGKPAYFVLFTFQSLVQYQCDRKKVLNLKSNYLVNSSSAAGSNISLDVEPILESFHSWQYTSL
jgi:hypothetical protein